MSELARFAQLRQQQLDSMTKMDQRFAVEAEGRWGKYCSLPLDLPVINDPALVDWFASTSRPAVKLRPDISFNASGEVGPVHTVDVWPNGYVDDAARVFSVNPCSTFTRDFPQFYQQLMDLLPVKQLLKFNFWSSTKEIQPHRDETFFVDIPASFRIRISDTNPTPTLWSAESVPDQVIGERIMLPRLAETNSLVWNNLRTKHGSVYAPGYNKILLLLDQVVIDWKKYYNLLDRSANKYSNHAVVSTNKLEDYVGPH